MIRNERSFTNILVSEDVDGEEEALVLTVAAEGFLMSQDGGVAVPDLKGDCLARSAAQIIAIGSGDHAMAAAQEPP